MCTTTTTTTTTTMNDSANDGTAAAPDNDDDGTAPRWQPALIELSLENVSYHPVSATNLAAVAASSAKEEKGRRPGRRQRRVVVLNRVSTTIQPHRLTAWMGPSGSGKTSLISVAAGLTRPGDIVVGDSDHGDGGIKINGERGTLPKQLIGVVWQDDLLLSNLTVRENLYFCARLKTTDKDDAAVRQLVQETLDELGIAHIADRVVGGGNGGGPSISGGERKRVAVGSELVVRPSLLFCDEPTSGLDATTAQSLILTLRQLCMEKGHSIVVVIHQPRAAIYALFDHLLLLSRGNVLYDGPACQVRSYLETACGESLPPETGLADWLMDVVTKDERRSSSSSGTTSSGVLASKWMEARKTFLLTSTTSKDDEHCSTTKRSTNHPSELRLSTLQELKAGPKYHTSTWTQFRLLTLRTLKQQRGERLTMTAVVLQVVYLFFTALFWWRLPDRTDRIFERNSLLFFMLIAQSNATVIVAVNVFQRERILLSRERAKKMYTVSSYFLAKTVSDMSNNVLLPLLYTLAVYWTGNFRPTAAAFFKNVFAFYWTFSTAQSMGLFLSIFISSPQIALILAPSITLFFMILGGFYIPLDNLHAGVRWASYLSFARYAYSSLAIAEYENRDIPCTDDIATGGSLDQCPLPGEQVLWDLGIRGVAESYWFNIGMVIVLQVFFRTAAYVLLRTKR